MEVSEKLADPETIDISEIQVSDNVRVTVTGDSKFGELLRSIKSIGLLEPIGLWRESGKYHVAYGHSRLEALRQLLYKKIVVGEHCIILPKKMTEKDAIIYNLSENLHRRDNSAAEIGRLVEILQQHENMSIEAIALALNQTAKRIESCLKLWRELPPEYRNKVRYKKNVGGEERAFLGMTTTRAVLDQFPPHERKDMLDFVSKEGITQQQVAVIAALRRGV